MGWPTIRTAVQRLINQGLVESRHGVVLFVLDQQHAEDKSPILQTLNGEVYTIADIQEIRIAALEPKSAELAAKTGYLRGYPAIQEGCRSKTKGTA